MVTPEAKRMAEIVAAHAPVLKEAGFIKRRYSFNRHVSDGIVHVAIFQMAQKEPPAWTEVPGLREREYGSFRLIFGVYVPQMNRSHTPRSDWINDFDAQLSPHPGRLIPAAAWWLEDPYAGKAAERFLREYGLPWLGQFPDRAAVLNAYERSGSLAIGLSPAGALDIADTYRAVGRFDDERRSLEHYVSIPVRGGHDQYLARYLQTRGHADLIPLIRARTERD